MSELDLAEEAYRRCEFAETRRLARSVLHGRAPAPEKIRAAELLAKLRPDRSALGLLLACLIFLALVLVRYAVL